MNIDETKIVEKLGGELFLIDDEGCLTLTDGRLRLKGDFTSLMPRLKTSNLQREFLVKASKIKGVEHPVLIDATAGMGEDAMILAATGFEVYLFEYDHAIAALLKDALRRAADIPELKDAVARMHFAEGNSIELMAEKPCTDERDLLDAALNMKPRRVVIKRPLKGPYLADIKPSYSINGKAIRYDCIVIPR